MKKFECKPLEFDADTKAIMEFNDLVTLYAGMLDFFEKYESQIEILEKHMSEEDVEKLYHALSVVPKTVAELAPTVKKELSKDEA